MVFLLDPSTPLSWTFFIFFGYFYPSWISSANLPCMKMFYVFLSSDFLHASLLQLEVVSPSPFTFFFFQDDFSCFAKLIFLFFCSPPPTTPCTRLVLGLFFPVYLFLSYLKPFFWNHIFHPIFVDPSSLPCAVESLAF